MIIPERHVDGPAICDQSGWYGATAVASQANVAVYLVNPDPAAGRSTERDTSGFANLTGGETFAGDRVAERAVERIWSDAGHYYVLGYSAGKSRSKAHKIDVSVNRPGAQVHARRERR